MEGETALALVGERSGRRTIHFLRVYKFHVKREFLERRREMLSTVPETSGGIALYFIHNSKIAISDVINASTNIQIHNIR